MGDKAPKDTRKQAQQKQTKTTADKQKKDEVQAARQAGNPKNDPKK
jgi:hypothetical protein